MAAAHVPTPSTAHHSFEKPSHEQLPTWFQEGHSSSAFHQSAGWIFEWRVIIAIIIMASLYSEVPQKVPTDESLGFSCPYKMFAVSLWELLIAASYPLPWQWDLASLLHVPLIHICKVWSGIMLAIGSTMYSVTIILPILWLQVRSHIYHTSAPDICERVKY